MLVQLPVFLLQFLPPIVQKWAEEWDGYRAS